MVLLLLPCSMTLARGSRAAAYQQAGTVQGGAGQADHAAPFTSTALST